MRKIAIIGCGAICRGLVESISRGHIRNVEVVALLDKDPTKCSKLVEEFHISAKICRSINELLEENPEIVVEVASPFAVKEYALPILEKGKILIILSSGALLDKDFREKLLSTCARTGGKIIIPSGAIGGLDILKTLALAGIEKITMRTRKPVKALPVHENIDRPKTIFKGPASEAVKKLPLNVNIVATITLATGIEPEIEVIADPNIGENIHEIDIESRISKAKIVLRNVPSPWNPRTSYIAVYSTILALKKLCEEECISIGV